MTDNGDTDGCKQNPTEGVPVQKRWDLRRDKMASRRLVNAEYRRRIDRHLAGSPERRDEFFKGLALNLLRYGRDCALKAADVRRDLRDEHRSICTAMRKMERRLRSLTPPDYESLAASSGLGEFREESTGPSGPDDDGDDLASFDVSLAGDMVMTICHLADTLENCATAFERSSRNPGRPGRKTAWPEERLVARVGSDGVRLGLFGLSQASNGSFLEVATIVLEMAGVNSDEPTRLVKRAVFMLKALR
jgi:hypothetical protein